MITNTVLERAIEMLPIASTDATRWHMCGVYIVSKDGKVTLTACDGHMLLTRELAEVKCPEGEYMLRKDAVASIKALFKVNKYADEFKCSITSDKSLVMSLGGVMATIPKMEGAYPDYSRVIPAPYEDRVAITLNAEYILAIADALREGNKRAAPTVRIVFDPTNPERPALIEKEGKSDFRAVIMPVRDAGTKIIADARKEAAEQEEMVSA